MRPMSLEVARAIMAELHDRSGVLDGIDDEILAEIEDAIADIIATMT
jgi:hypothetical protein